MLFNGVWTAFIATPYLAFAPTYFPNLAHRLIVAAVDAVTMIFWFAGFIALAAYLPVASHFSGSVRSSLQAATVFGSFEWFVCCRILEGKRLTGQGAVCGHLGRSCHGGPPVPSQQYEAHSSNRCIVKLTAVVP